MAQQPEILAPAGSAESLTAAVRCGADAVYLGGKGLSARAGAEGFGGEALREAVSYCHIRGVKVYQALNTLIFDGELALAEKLVREAADAGVDALIVQDLALLPLLRHTAPRMPLHASTQMGIHSAEGARALEALGFSRVVLARELSAREIGEIARQTSLELECFVHGALCMCVSGQCTLSSIIGGRSGNRGQCAQPCRLPFSNGESTHALSLRDLSLVEQARELEKLGVASLKIEGRLKRPEYVAAATAACRRALDGDAVDMAALESVFSRSGFTRGYFTGERGPEMFGTRGREDVAAAAPVLADLAALYRREARRIPLAMELIMAAGQPVRLSVADESGSRAAVEGEIPQPARTAPTNGDKVRAALEKTGETPYFLAELHCELEEGLMLPVSALNALRRDALEALSAERERRAFPRHGKASPQGVTFMENVYRPRGGPALRARLRKAEQLTPELAEQVELLILPLHEISRLDDALLSRRGERIAAELPRVWWKSGDELRALLESARSRGIARVAAGGLGGLRLAGEMGFVLHGDFGLNITNTLSLGEYAAMGLADCTLGMELDLSRTARLGGSIPRGMLAYGKLPLMITRNPPGGREGETDMQWLTDRKELRFLCTREAAGAYTQLHNCVPLYLADRLGELQGVDFLLLYFTDEAPPECLRIADCYRQGAPKPENGAFTRGFCYRPVL